MSFSQQKRNYYPGTQTVAPSANAQGVVAGNPAMKPQGTVAAGTGETPEEFATARQAYNMFANSGNQPTKPAGAVVEEPATKPQGTVSKPVVTGGGSVAAGGVMPYTGGKDNAQAALDYLGALYTSPQEEERRRKASVANQRIMAVGDALRHIGNIYNTVQGAPSQTFTNPVQEEYARYQQAKALRDRANQQYYTYQQQKAAQDALAARWEAQMEYNKARDAANLEATKAYRDATLAEQTRYHDMVHALNTRKADDAKANNERRADIMQQRVNKQGSGRSGGGRGGRGISDYDLSETRTKKENPDGTTTWTTEKKRRGVNGSQSSSTSKTTTKKKLPGAGTGKKKLPR